MVHIGHLRIKFARVVRSAKQNKKNKGYAIWPQHRREIRIIKYLDDLLLRYTKKATSRTMAKKAMTPMAMPASSPALLPP